MVDIADETNPKVVSLFPVPAEANFCARGGRFGPHNVHEMRPGTLADPNTIFWPTSTAACGWSTSADAAAPREIAYFVPEAPQGRKSIQFNDIMVGCGQPDLRQRSVRRRPVHLRTDRPLLTPSASDRRSKGLVMLCCAR